jgi:phosphate:Na+ symporter
MLFSKKSNAIIVTLASQGLISLPAGIALMLGAEVGTCADTLVPQGGSQKSLIQKSKVIWSKLFSD